MNKGNYVDGFVLIIPKKNVSAYKKMAAEGVQIWKKFGALDYKECMGQDLKPSKGNPVLSFTKMAKAKSTDTVWFSYIVFKDKKHRDAVNKKVMDYFSKKYADKKHEDMPFDMKRMAYGGFSVAVSS
ncbi:MAG: DUF1428 domain-containing protein [Candidatus Paceibacterota bacterium]